MATSMQGLISFIIGPVFRGIVTYGCNVKLDFIQIGFLRIKKRDKTFVFLSHLAFFTPLMVAAFSIVFLHMLQLPMTSNCAVSQIVCAFNEKQKKESSAKVVEIFISLFTLLTYERLIGFIGYKGQTLKYFCCGI